MGDLGHGNLLIVHEPKFECSVAAVPRCFSLLLVVFVAVLSGILEELLCPHLSYVSLMVLALV